MVESDGEGPAARLSTADRLWGHADELEHDAGLRHDLGRFVAKLSPALKRCCAILTNGSIGEAVRKERNAPLIALRGRRPPASQGS